MQGVLAEKVLTTWLVQDDSTVDTLTDISGFQKFISVIYHHHPYWDREMAQ